MSLPSSIVARQREVNVFPWTAGLSNNTGSLHTIEEWKTSVVGRALPSIGTTRCCTGKTRSEISQHLEEFQK
jgi:hypothetical protein